VQFQRYVIKETGSMAIAADSLHYSADLLVNSGIIIGLIAVTALGWTLADPIVALAVAFYLIVTAWRIALRAMDMLMDRELDDDAREEIRAIILSHPEVRSMHDLRTRSAGVHSFIQLHLELDGDLSLSEAHRIADEVEKLVSAKFENAEILIHEDPEGLDEERPDFA
ncbi:MAG: cation diffusion facilitator family transporter, partial [Alphaproteobacteria bacterium]|nr:cation diffusion facilitator family transporter [Alphaproteobacteria bacterium]